MRTTTETDYRERLLRVLVYIQNHLDEAVSLDELAAVANFFALPFSPRLSRHGGGERDGALPPPAPRTRRVAAQAE